MIDLSQPQTYLVVIHLPGSLDSWTVAKQGLLREILPELRGFCRHWGYRALVNAFEQAPNGKAGSRDRAEASQLGMLLREVATVDPHDSYDYWLQHFHLMFEGLQPEQRRLEMLNLQARLHKELAALEIQQQVNDQPVVPEVKPNSSTEQLTSSDSGSTIVS